MTSNAVFHAPSLFFAFFHTDEVEELVCRVFFSGSPLDAEFGVECNVVWIMFMIYGTDWFRGKMPEWHRLKELGIYADFGLDWAWDYDQPFLEF